MIFGLNSSLRAAISTASLRLLLVAVVLCFALKQEATAQNFKRGDKQLVTGGILVRDTTKIDSAKIETKEELKRREKLHRRKMDSLARYEQRLQRAIEQDRVDEEGNIIPREPLFSDSSSLSKVCLTAAVLPGYGQIYNKQYGYRKQQKGGDNYEVDFMLDY